MSYQDIIVEQVEGWLEVTIHRPEKMNSLRETTAEEILDALGDAESKRDIAAVILRGSDKAFCTGIDTSEFKIGDNEYFDFYRKRKRSRKVNSSCSASCPATPSRSSAPSRASRSAAGWNWPWSAT
jgi:enoyl-CoA hydratase/carnithine racemase